MRLPGFSLFLFFIQEIRVEMFRFHTPLSLCLRVQKQDGNPTTDGLSAVVLMWFSLLDDFGDLRHVFAGAFH